MSDKPAIPEVLDYSALKTPDDLRETLRKVHRDVGRIMGEQGIDEVLHLPLGGFDQYVHLRGHDREAPILLFLHGGPGVIVSDIAYAYQRPWEDFFLVVNWDQRGFGRSWGDEADAEKLKGTLSREQLISDAIELIDYLRERFGQQKVIVVGQSWGSVLTLELARRVPERLHVACAQGLAANWMGSAEACRQKHIELAQARGDTTEVQRLQEVGPPPVEDGPEAVMQWPMKLAVGIPDPHSWRNIDGPGDGWPRRMDGLRFVSPDLKPEEFTAIREFELNNPLVVRERFVEMMHSVIDWDAVTDVGCEFEVPLVVMMGRFDLQTPIELAREYFQQVKAPWKKWVEFPEAAHALNIEQPGLAVLSLVQDVLPAVHGKVPAGAELVE